MEVVVMLDGNALSTAPCERGTDAEDGEVEEIKIEAGGSKEDDGVRETGGVIGLGGRE